MFWLTTRHAARRLALIASLAALSACSSPPSESEARAAVEALYSNMFAKPASVKLLGCEKSGQAYRCDVTIEIVAGQKVTAAMRFIKTGDGWVASQ